FQTPIDVINHWSQMYGSFDNLEYDSENIRKYFDSMAKCNTKYEYGRGYFVDYDNYCERLKNLFNQVWICMPYNQDYCTELVFVRIDNHFLPINPYQLVV